jgi:hypothetical protein
MTGPDDQNTLAASEMRGVEAKLVNEREEKVVNEVQRVLHAF